MIDKLIDIHLSGDACIKRTEKENYDILHSDIVPDNNYNYVFLKNNNVNLDTILDEAINDLKEYNVDPSIYVLSTVINDEIKSDRLELDHTDVWMVLNDIKPYKLDFDVTYENLKEEDLNEFVDTFMINFSSDDPNEPYQTLHEGYKRVITDNFNDHNGFKTVYYVGKINNKIVCTTLGIYKDDSIILYSGSVNKELRGKGIFKEFLNYIISELRKLGIKNICLQTEQGYYPEKLYTKMGFKEVALGRCYNIKG